MQECKICNDKQGITKTEDGHEICKHCYDEVFHEIFKGQFTLQEGQETIQYIRRYDKTIMNYLLNIRRLARAEGIDKYLMLSQIMEHERVLSNIKFNKDRRTLKRSEHLIIIEEVFNTRLSGIPEIYLNEGGNLLDDYRATYLLNCDYLSN